MSIEKPKVAIIGLGFGAEFIPIYQRHPNAEIVALCQRNEENLNKVSDEYGIAKRFTKYESLLEDPDIDAVHINTPIPHHAEATLQAMRAGKHVACTVPMATSVEDCESIVRLSAESGMKYMMMETVVYAREFLYMKELYDSGDLGKLQFLKASHQQDMDGWPGYWPGLPPMHYATHCVGPVLGLGRHEAEYVSCFGSGTVRDDIAQKSGNKFAVESCHIKIKDSDLSAHIWRFLYDVARQYRESIDVYGSKKSFEWTLVEGEPSILHVAKRPEAEIPEKVDIPDYAHLLPEPIQKFTQTIEDADHLSFVQGGGHGGSHPHMVNEFLSALVEDRDPWPNAKTAANWTCVGICAHQSTEQGGARVDMPAFTI